jgi:hypothetical protein
LDFLDWFVFGGSGFGGTRQAVEALEVVGMMLEKSLVLETHNLMKKFGGITATDNVRR